MQAAMFFRRGNIFLQHSGRFPHYEMYRQPQRRLDRNCGWALGVVCFSATALCHAQALAAFVCGVLRAG